MRLRFTIILLAAAFAGFLGCAEKDDQPAPGTQSQPKIAKRIESDLMILPAQVAPGQTVQVSYKDPVFAKEESIVVTFGDQPGRIVRVSNRSTVHVLVPELKPGTVEVTVRSGRDVLGTATLTITHPPLMRVYFRVREGELKLDRVQPYTGRPDHVATSGRRLSYDMLSDEGELLHTAAIPFPAAEFEGVDADGRIRREQGPKPKAFVLKVPYFEAPFRIKLLEADPQLNLKDPDDRARRRLLKEFTIPKEGQR